MRKSQEVLSLKFWKSSRGRRRHSDIQSTVCLLQKEECLQSTEFCFFMYVKYVC